MRHTKKATAAIMILFIVALSIGCAGKTDLRPGSYKTLAAGATIYENGYPAFLELHARGLVSDAQKAEGKKLATRYWAAYHSATEVLVALDTVQTAEAQAQVTVAMAEVSRCLAELIKYIQPFVK